MLRWSIQRANGQYRDHIVGQLTTTLPDLWFIFKDALVWPKHSVRHLLSQRWVQLVQSRGGWSAAASKTDFCCQEQTFICSCFQNQKSKLLLGFQLRLQHIGSEPCSAPIDQDVLSSTRLEEAIQPDLDLKVVSFDNHSKTCLIAIASAYQVGWKGEADIQVIRQQTSDTPTTPTDGGSTKPG